MLLPKQSTTIGRDWCLGRMHVPEDNFESQLNFLSFEPLVFKSQAYFFFF